MMHFAPVLGALACAAMMALMCVPMAVGMIRSLLRRRTSRPAAEFPAAQFPAAQFQVPASEPTPQRREHAGALR
jgi:hypothetical protein